MQAEENVGRGKWFMVVDIVRNMGQGARVKDSLYVREYGIELNYV